MCELTQSSGTSGRTRAEVGHGRAHGVSGSSRRELLAAAELAAGAVSGAGMSASASVDSRGVPRGGGPGERMLLRGGVVLTMDAKLGDFDRADVLIEGSKIAAVGREICRRPLPR